MSAIGFGASRRAVVPRLLAGLALAASLGLGSAQADPPPVTVGEVSTTVGHEEVVPLMKSTLVAEVAKVPVPAGKRFIVSASLTKLESKKSGSTTTTSCAISLALRDAKEGNLLGMLQGTGAVMGNPDAKSSNEAVEAAVRGATKSLPQAMGVSSR